MAPKNWLESRKNICNIWPGLGSFKPVWISPN